MFKKYLIDISLFIFVMNIFASDVTEEMARKAASTRLSAQQRIWDKNPRQLKKETGSFGKLSIESMKTIVDYETGQTLETCRWHFIIIFRKMEIHHEKYFIGDSLCSHFIYCSY